MLEYAIGFPLGMSVAIPVGIIFMTRSALIALKAKYAFKMISLGDNPEDYRWDIDDARIDPIARLLVGGRRLDDRSRATEEEIDREILR